ncbi:MAG: NrfD/PsrC family molybdoenzyme membrane anchor subunit [Eggerthellaceae bacterium]|jgi:molybdopterin-containing oxidoreductase family membrane subunit|nr:NrfD/PsrC family molybdoenzyme membrane anchor subunit [Eggerthellaceae bacterium]
MERPTRKIALVGIILLVVGLIAWIMQLTGGLLAGSNMTNVFLWGLMIAVFAFLVGFGAGSQFVASAIILSGKEELKPLARIAGACGLACVCAAGVAILADLGAIRNALAMIVGMNPRSPLAWDMIAMCTFIVLSIVQLVMIARDARSVKVWAVLAGLAALALQIVEGLLFSTQTAHGWWATPIMPVDFLAVAFVSGFALILLIACVKGASSKALAWLGRICASAIAVHLVLALIDLCLMFFEGTPESAGILAAVGSNILLYLVELILPFIAMIMLFLPKTRGQKKPALIASILVIVGIFAHRLMLLFPAYNAPSLYLQLSGTDFTTGPYPISTGRYLDWDLTFANTTPYFPAGPEWLAMLFPIGLALVAAVVILFIMKKLQKDKS